MKRGWFVTERAGHGLYRIVEQYYSRRNRANLWLVLGRDANMLVDTGLGLGSLKTHLADILDKPLKVVATHVHFDHAGACHEFDQVFIHENEHRALVEADQDLILSRNNPWMTPRDFTRLPYASFSFGDYSVTACPQAQKIAHGDVIDLGDRAYEVMHLPGHSPGSIGLFDANGGRLFSGDVVYDGDLLDDLPGSVVDDYVLTMERLLTLSADEVRPGHHGSFDRDRLRHLVTTYIDEKRAPQCRRPAPDTAV